MRMRHVVNFSGGKDSTALLLMMLERRMQVDDMVFCDTGVEFPQMYEHIEKLVEWEMTGADNLRYCRDKDFDWGGLYDDFSRVSCFVCPLQRVSELKILYTKHPDLWRRLKELDKKSPRSFKSSHTLTQLEQRFQREGHMKGFFIKT